MSTDRPPDLRPLRETGDMPYVTPWASAMLRRLVPVGVEIPTYDSPAFHNLPADSPLRIASAIRAAEARRSEIAEDLEALTDELDEQYRRDMDLHDRVAAIITGTARRLQQRHKTATNPDRVVS